MTTAPEVDRAETADDDSLVHIVCRHDVNLAACGKNVTLTPWGHGLDDGDRVCVVCRDVSEHDAELPAGALCAYPCCVAMPS